MIHLLTSNLHHLRTLNLSGLAVTAQVQPDGTLLPVAGAFDKLLAAAGEKSLPRIHTVVVARDQPLEHFNLTSVAQSPHLFKVPYADLHLIRAHSLAEAVELLAIDTQTRWGSIDCSLPPPDPAFVGRKQLLKAVQDFILTHDSGYLVIAGGMGKGKSAFMAELIRTALTRGEAPVYHFIGYHPSASGKPHNIAACLYSRLRRKYAFPEPEAWQPFDIEDRLERLLENIGELGAQENRRPEVLYIDAADQAEASTLESFLSAALRTLPRGVLCVITSRTHPEWLNTPQPVGVWEMEDYTDDRQDVQAYLQQQGSQLSPPLSDTLIEQIVTHPNPPVFFTVIQCLRQLADPAQPAGQKEKLRKEASLWVVPPAELIQTEARRMLAGADKLGFAESKVWRTLGLLAVAREALSEDLLSELELWDGETSERLLKLATNFFNLRPPLRQPALPYQFDHPGYHQAVISHLSQKEKINCHRLIAAGCLRWKELDGEARRYALHHSPYHLREARQWDELEKLLADITFIDARCPAGLIFETVADIQAASNAPVALERIFTTVVKAIHTRAVDAFWLQWRSALVKFFGTYASWPASLRATLEESEGFNVMHFLAEAYDMEGNHPQAAEVLENILKRVSPDNHAAYARTCIKLAAVYEHQKKYPDALHIIVDLLSKLETEAGSTYWWAQYQRGITLRCLGQYAESRAILEEIRAARVGADLDYADLHGYAALHQLGVVDLKEGKLVEAERKFKESLNEQSESEWNHRRAFDYRRLGQVYVLTERLAEAQLAFAEAGAISKRCGNRRYLDQVQENIAEFLVAPHIQQTQPETLSLSDLTQQFGIDEDHLPLAFRRLSLKGIGYLQVLDSQSACTTDLLARWDIAHDQGYWHASVSIVISDAQGNVAWQQRGETDSRGKWDISVAGHAGVLESDADTAVRETHEEIGLSVSPERLIRIGQPGEFHKVGAPSVEQDGHENQTSYVYQTSKMNYECVSVFILSISEEEKAQMVMGNEEGAQAIRWVSLLETAYEARAHPEQFASAFKQVFGHPELIDRIRRTVTQSL